VFEVGSPKEGKRKKGKGKSAVGSWKTEDGSPKF